MRSKIDEKRTVSIGQYGFLVFDCFCLFLLSEITDKLVIVILLAFFFPCQAMETCNVCTQYYVIKEVTGCN